MANYTIIKPNKLKAIINLYKTGIEDNYIIINTFDTDKGKVATIAQKRPNSEIYILNCYYDNLKLLNNRTEEFENK